MFYGYIFHAAVPFWHVYIDKSSAERALRGKQALHQAVGEMTFTTAL